jgi:hypothetical protein
MNRPTYLQRIAGAERRARLAPPTLLFRPTPRLATGFPIWPATASVADLSDVPRAEAEPNPMSATTPPSPVPPPKAAPGVERSAKTGVERPEKPNVEASAEPNVETPPGRLGVEATATPVWDHAPGEAPPIDLRPAETRAAGKVAAASRPPDTPAARSERGSLASLTGDREGLDGVGTTTASEPARSPSLQPVVSRLEPPASPQLEPSLARASVTSSPPRPVATRPEERTPTSSRSVEPLASPGGPEDAIRSSKETRVPIIPPAGSTPSATSATTEPIESSSGIRVRLEPAPVASRATRAEKPSKTGGVRIGVLEVRVVSAAAEEGPRSNPAPTAPPMRGGAASTAPAPAAPLARGFRTFGFVQG